jgi:hypothetical protein
MSINLPDNLHWYETEAGSHSSDDLIDVENADLVLQFAYRYLEARSLAPGDDEVRNVTATIARYKGPRIVPGTALESFLAGLLTF